MDAVGSFLAKKVFDSKVKSVSNSLSDTFGFGDDDGDSYERKPSRREKQIEEEREISERHQKRREKSYEKAAELREKYGMSRPTSSTPYYRSSGSRGGMCGECCTLF